MNATHIGIVPGVRLHKAAITGQRLPFVFSNSSQGMRALMKWARGHGTRFVFGVSRNGCQGLILRRLRVRGYSVRVLPECADPFAAAHWVEHGEPEQRIRSSGWIWAGALG